MWKLETLGATTLTYNNNNLENIFSVSQLVSELHTQQFHTCLCRQNVEFGQTTTGGRGIELHVGTMCYTDQAFLSYADLMIKD